MVLVSRRPPLYRHARDLFHECGPYQLRAALNAFGKDAEPEDLYRNRWMRDFDWSLPPLMPAILRRYGIYARSHFVSRERFKERILAELRADKPVLFVIYSIVKPGGGLHWISAWGYDESSSECLCYDSKAPAAEGGIGNTRYATDLLLAHLPWRGTFALTIEDRIA